MDYTVTAGPPIFQRVLLKLSGESFCRPGEGGINLEEVSRIARQTARVAARGVQLAIVVGGGNILRGAQLSRGSDVIKEATAWPVQELPTWSRMGWPARWSSAAGRSSRRGR